MRLLLTLFLGISLQATDWCPRLVISELMYNPPGGDPFEFIELYNAGSEEINLSRASFSGITYQFAADTKLSSGGILVLGADINPNALKSRYPNVIFHGFYSGRLANSGELIKLNTSAGRTLCAVAYGDKALWPTRPDGPGYSLELADPARAQADPGNWRSSLILHGSPGALTSFPAPTLYISEIRASGSDSEGPESADFVELHNLRSEPVSLESWGLTDDLARPHRYAFPAGATIAPGGFLTVWLTKAEAGPFRAEFGLETRAGYVALFDAAGEVSGVVSYGGQLRGFSLGFREGQWVLNNPTPGAPNVPAEPLPDSQLKLNEWYADSLSGVGDWVELYNPSPFAASLEGHFFTINGHCSRLEFPTFIESGGFLAFRATGEATEPDAIGFKLGAQGAVLGFVQPSGAIIDSISYGPQSDGQSQGRLPDGSPNVVFLLDGPSPGASNLGDDDSDGMPNQWEIRHRLNPRDDADRPRDADGDGASNYQEFQGGTDPQDRSDVLTVQAAKSASGLDLSFNARAGRSYILESVEELRGKTWSSFSLFNSDSDQRAALSAPAHETVRFFRLQVVAAPTHPQTLQLLKALPGPGSMSNSSGTNITLEFNQPLDPVSLGTNGLVVRDDLGRPVNGRIRFFNSFRQFQFEPAIPFAHLSTFSVSLNTNLSAAFSSAKLTEPATWTFTTGLSILLPDNQELYSDDLTVTPLEVTLFPGVYTLADVHADRDNSDAITPYLEVLFRAPGFDTAPATPNATLELRGRTARTATQKSYQIKFKGNNTWRGGTSADINKHPFDLARMRNKLSYDLVREVPELASTRTFLVTMRLDGTNFGAYTQVESPKREWLQARGWDEAGQLYKAKSFRFRRLPNLRLKTDPAYSVPEFERTLEIKGSDEHGKLLAMLDDVANTSIPINRIIDKHFQRDNYIAWLAWNICTESLDSSSQNFYLYSPLRSSTWYFIPWDQDGAWGFYDQPLQLASNPDRPPRFDNLANWWDVPLHRRFFSDPANLSELLRKINELIEGPLAFNRVREHVERLRLALFPHIANMPDFARLPVLNPDRTLEEWQEELTRFPAIPQQRRAILLQTLDRPMPVFLGTPSFQPQGWRFNWENSVDLQGDALFYDFQLAASPLFEPQSILVEQLQLSQNEIFIPGLASGTYYWRLIIRQSKNPAENWQYAFDSHVIPATGRIAFGVRELIIP